MTNKQILELTVGKTIKEVNYGKNGRGFEITFTDNTILDVYAESVIDIDLIIPRSV